MRYNQLQTQRTDLIDSQYLSDTNYKTPVLHADAMSSKLVTRSAYLLFIYQML